MTGGEDQPQQVVADVVVEPRVDHFAELVCSDGVLGVEFVAELRVARFGQFFVAQMVQRAALGRSHQPGTGALRNAKLGPVFERGHQRVLRAVLGQAEIAGQPRRVGDDLGRLDVPDRGDAARGVLGGGINLAHRSVARRRG